MRSFWPGRSPQITVVRARSSSASVCTSTRPGTSTSWSIAAAIISSLRRVRWTSTARLSVAFVGDRLPAGSVRIADARGSLDVSGWSSLATSSDWTVILVNSSTASTTYSMAATPRWARETSRVEVTAT